MSICLKCGSTLTSTGLCSNFNCENTLPTLTEEEEEAIGELEEMALRENINMPNIDGVTTYEEKVLPVHQLTEEERIAKYPAMQNGFRAEGGFSSRSVIFSNVENADDRPRLAFSNKMNVGGDSEEDTLRIKRSISDRNNIIGAEIVLNGRELVITLCDKLSLNALQVELVLCVVRTLIGKEEYKAEALSILSKLSTKSSGVFTKVSKKHKDK